MTQKVSNPSEEQSGRSRYPGTRPFRDLADDYDRFFGRTEDGERLYLRVLSVPLTVLFGMSGFGKTSLLQAWLFPRLRQKPFLPVMVRLNDTNETLTEAVKRAIQEACGKETLEFTEGKTEGLWELLSTTIVWRDDLLLTPVLVFDPFEEVFTLRDASFRADLATELGALASGIRPERLHTGRSGVSEQFAGRPNVKIVISLREDYLGALEEFSAAIPGLFQERLRLEPLKEKEARKAITEPAQLRAKDGEEPYWAPRFEFEDSALEAMIGYLKGTSGIIEPFQLQLLCRHAEEITHAKGSTQNDPVKLTLADFSKGKEFASVLENFYQDTLLQLPHSQRRRARELCEVGLLDASGHRLMLEEGQIRRDFRSLDDETLSVLSVKRLLRQERRLESVFYEISHDRLAASIFTSRRFRLPKWVKVTGGVGLAIIFICFVGIVLLIRSNQRVEEARDRAEALLSFMLGEKFLGEVRDVGRSTMLEQVQKQVTRTMGSGDQGGALNRGLALRNAGDVERMQGRLAESIEDFQEALKAIESSPESPDRWREVARTNERLGEALSDQGQLTPSLSHYEAAVKAWSQVAKGPGDPSRTLDDTISLAGNLVTVGDKKRMMGKATLALKDLEDAVQIVLNVLFGCPGGHEGCEPVAAKVEAYPDARVLQVLSQAAMLRASILYFQEDFESPVALATQARWLRPSSISARENALVALVLRGSGRVTEPQRALEDYRNALAEFDEFGRLDPNNRLWQRQRAANQLLVVRGIVACQPTGTKGCDPLPQLAEAEVLCLEAIGTLRALGQNNPSNVALVADIGWALQEYARVLEAQDRKKERLAILEESGRIYQDLQYDGANTEAVATFGWLLLEKAAALAALARKAEADKTVQRSVDLFSDLVRDHENVCGYVLGLREARQRQAEFLRRNGDSAGADAAEQDVKRLAERSEALQYANWKERTQELDKRHVAHVNEGAKLFNENNYVAALEQFRTAEPCIREYIALKPADIEGYKNLQNLYDWIQTTQQRLGNTWERTEPLSALVHAAQIAVWLAPEADRPEINQKLIDAWHSLSVTLDAKERRGEELAVLQEEIAYTERLVQGNPQNARYRWLLGNAQCGLGRIRRSHKKAGWEATIRSGLIHTEKAAEIDTRNSEHQRDLGHWRGYLSKELNADGRNENAREEHKLACEAYREAVRRDPANEKAKEELRVLVEQGSP